jgi:competence protein ComEC
MKKSILAFIIIALFLIYGCGTTLADPNSGIEPVVINPTDAFAVTTVDNISTTRESTTHSINEPEINIESKAVIPLSADIIRDLRVHFIDVGQADCVFIELPTGENMLIDAGNNSDSNVINEFLNDHKVNAINYLFGSHPHEDHIGSLGNIINEYRIERLFMPNITHNTVTFENVLQAVEHNGVQIETPKAGEYIINDSENHLYLKVMAPAKDEYVNLNNYSIILKLAYMNTSFLFTGDAEDIIEYEMIDSGADIGVDVLKIGHHGSDTSTSEAFLMSTSPSYAIISVGKNNIYGHPSSNIIEKLTNANITVYRTDEAGTITAISDGDNIMFQFENTNFHQAAIIEPSSSTSSSKSPASTAKNLTQPTTSDADIFIQTTPKTTAINNVEKKVDAVKTYIGNKNSKIFHETNCSTLPAEKNRIYFDSRDEALNNGYIPCKRCKP